MRSFPFILLLLSTLVSLSQENKSSLHPTYLVKTNLLSFAASRPTFSLEKVFTPTISAELSFTQGRFNDFLFTDEYSYSGFLLRMKKYITPFVTETITPYVGAYTGNLRRTIRTKGRVDPTGWNSIGSRDFSAQSIRAGGTIGVAYLSRQHFVFDGQTSFGYGRYVHIIRPDTHLNGFADVQIWLSVGYCF